MKKAEEKFSRFFRYFSLSSCALSLRSNNYFSLLSFSIVTRAFFFFFFFFCPYFYVLRANLFSFLSFTIVYLKNYQFRIYYARTSYYYLIDLLIYNIITTVIPLLISPPPLCPCPSLANPQTLTRTYTQSSLNFLFF